MCRVWHDVDYLDACKYVCYFHCNICITYCPEQKLYYLSVICLPKLIFNAKYEHVWYEETSQEMSTDPNAASEFAMLLSADLKFTNTFQKKKKPILTHTTISLTLCNSFIMDHAGIVRGEIGSRYLLHADSCKSRCATVSSVSVRISRRKPSQTQQPFLWPQQVPHKKQFQL